MQYTYEKRVSDERGTLYYLDVGEVSDDVYDSLKPNIEAIGGHWREREKAFVFGEDVEKDIEDIFNSNFQVSDEWLKAYREQHKTQYFPTPKSVADRVAELAEIQEGYSVLEPSAGRGNLIDSIHVKCYVTAIEPLMENCDYLEKKGYSFVCSTFEEAYPNIPKYDRVIMNPPFSGQRDIKHFMLAYDKLKSGGVIVGVLSENALYYNTETTRKFNKFLDESNAYVESVPFHSFKESGTTIDTVIVKVAKP